MQPFQYAEEIHFWHDGKPYFGYMQRSFNKEGAPMHMESGYLRYSDFTDDASLKTFSDLFIKGFAQTICWR